MRVDAEHGAHAVGVFVVQLQAVLAADSIVDAGHLHLEAGGIDQHIDRIVRALEDRALSR